MGCGGVTPHRSSNNESAHNTAVTREANNNKNERTTTSANHSEPYIDPIEQCFGGEIAFDYFQPVSQTDVLSLRALSKRLFESWKRIDKASLFVFSIDKSLTLANYPRILQPFFPNHSTCVKWNLNRNNRTILPPQQRLLL